MSFADHEQIIDISVYETSSVEKDDQMIGERVRICRGSAPDWKAIFSEERRGARIARAEGEIQKRGDMAVLGNVMCFPAFDSRLADL